MKTKLLIIITILSTSFTWGQNNLVLSWQEALGGSDADYMISISSDLCFVAGRTKSADGDVLGVHDNYDTWLVKLDCGASSIS